MKVGYRRMSGAIGISEHEQGTRGLWYEKRMALVNWLKKKGHVIEWASRPTKASSDLIQVGSGPWDLLMVEFGSSNSRFYGDDLAATLEMTRKHKGPIVFLCDDPDLPFLWSEVEKRDFGRWTCWYNCTKPSPFGGQPQEIKVVNFPFSSLQVSRPPTEEFQREDFVYIGRPLGRSRVVREIVAHKVPWRVYAKPAEWASVGVLPLDPPKQSERPVFYSQQLACLALADNKHKNLGWRTGRAYHAVLSGCPALVEGDNWALQHLGFPFFQHVTELHEWREQLREKGYRSELVNKTVAKVKKEITLADQALAEIK